MRVAVLGAYGQLGTDLRHALSAHDVVPFGHGDFDVRDSATAARKLSETRPDVIVNATAFHKVELCEEDPDAAFAVNATAAMYSGFAVNEPNQARPTNRRIPVTNCRNPGIQIPQIPVVMSTFLSRCG